MLKLKSDFLLLSVDQLLFYRNIMSQLEYVGFGLTIVETVLSMCRAVYSRSQDAKANKERCQQVAERVRVLEDLVLTIKPCQISSSVYKALKELHTTLESAQTLITKFSKTKAFAGFMKSSSLKEKFHEVDKKLSDHLHVLSGALLIDQGKVIHEIYDTVRGKKLPASWSSSSVPSIMSASDIYSPPSTTPVPMYSPAALPPVPCIMPSMHMYNSMSAMPFPTFMTPTPLPGATAPYSITTTRIVSNKSVMLSPTDIPSTLANLFSK